jgi:hypothetical protein
MCSFPAISFTYCSTRNHWLYARLRSQMTRPYHRYSICQSALLAFYGTNVFSMCTCDAWPVYTSTLMVYLPSSFRQISKDVITVSPASFEMMCVVRGTPGRMRGSQVKASHWMLASSFSGQRICLDMRSSWVSMVRQHTYYARTIKRTCSSASPRSANHFHWHGSTVG